MLRLFTKITFTPAAVNSTDGLPQSVTNTELYKQLNKPETKPRQTIVFDFVTEIEVNISHMDLTSTATITIPRKLKFNGEDIATGTQAIFRRGDKVKIECGYYPDLKVIFEGYIADVAVNTPIIIKCEDEMFQLQKKHILYPLKYNLQTVGKRGKKLKTPKIIPTKIKLKDFVKDVLLDGTPYKDSFICDIDMQIAIKRFDCSAREVLNKFKETFVGLYAYFQDGVLNVGFLNDANRTLTAEFQFEDNIIDDSKLSYRRQEDIELVCCATSYNVDTGEQISVTWPPDVGPETPTAHIEVFTAKKMSKADLLQFAKQNCESRKYEGYYGSFLTFGETYVRPGDRAKLIDGKYPERNGTYLVESVRRNFGINGYRQLIELGARVAFK